MPVPTITSITPSSGWSAGRQLVEIRGTNFRLPTPAAAGPGVKPRAPQSVRVLFGDVEARSVRVYSASLLRVLTPAHWPTRWFYEFENGERAPAPGPNATPPQGATLVEVSGTVDVTVLNVDDDGDAIAVESVVAAAAYSFVRPRFDRQGVWDRAVTALVDALRIAVIDNVVDDADVDYDVDTGEVMGLTSVSNLPAIALVDKRFDDPMDSREQGTVEEAGSDDYVLVRRPPSRKDFSCRLVGMSDDVVELRAMAQLVDLFFHDNADLFILKNPDVPAAGHYRLELRHGADPGISESGRIGRTNLLVFTMQVIVADIPTESAPGIAPVGLPFMPAGSSHEGVVGVTRPLKVGTRSYTPLG
jgi:hypothetical protein